MTTKPWLLLDVDGPLNPFTSRLWKTQDTTTGYTFHRLPENGFPQYRVALNPAHGAALLALTDLYDLAWATTWRDSANTEISPRIGLPSDLPVIPLDLNYRPHTHRLSYKTDQVAAWTAGRPFAWVDDDINRYDRTWLAADERVGPFLLRRVEPGTGLTEHDFTALREWATALAAGT